MAVTGLRKVSVVDSYLNDNRLSASTRFINNEGSTTPTSYIRKMWQDLESEGRIRENGRCKMSENTAIITGPESPHSSYLESESIESDYTSMDVNEIENVCPQITNENQIVSEHGYFDVPEKERVRKIFLEWGTKSFKGHNRCCTSRINSCTSRGQWLGENEHKRVRIVREWIESSTQQGDIGQTGSDTGQTGLNVGQTGSNTGQTGSIRRIYGRQALLDLLAKFKNERKQEVDNLLENRFVSNFGHRHRIQVLLKARFLRNPCFLQVEKLPYLAARELEILTPKHSVSDIRKGFLSRLSNNIHSAEGAQSDSDTSSDSEMTYDPTKQSDKIVENFENTNSTSNLKSHNQPQFSSIGKQPLTVVPDHFNCGPSSSNNEKKHELSEESEEIFQAIQDEIGEERDEIYNTEMSRETLSTECITSGHMPEEEDDDDNNDDVWNHSTRTESDAGVDIDSDDNEFEWYQETIRSDFQESHEEWFDNDNDNILVDPTENWYGRTSYMEAALLDRSNTFNASDDDDNGRRVELRELTNRGRVSNLLQSDFGVRLNQLMRSYMARQDHTFESENEWMMDEEQHSLNGSEVVDTEREADTQITDFHENLNLVSERDIINGLRNDMETLKQRMDEMQKMMEACMNMQHELQQSVQQEVYSALNRSSNLKDGIWNHQFETKSVKEDVCSLCCDDGGESLPNKSAHMYICSQCADKINWSKLKETVRHP